MHREKEACKEHKRRELKKGYRNVSFNQTLLEEETGVPGDNRLFRNFAGDCKQKKRRRRVRSAKPNQFHRNKRKKNARERVSVESESEEKRKLLEQFMVGARDRENARERARVLGFWELWECVCVIERGKRK